MNRVTVFDPFADVFPHLLRGLVETPRRGEPEALNVRIDVKEAEKDYVVHADMPGVNKEDINVEIDGNRVSISGSVKKTETAKDGEKVLRTERYEGTVSRTFELASEIDEDAAQARYDNGVLELTLPKKAAASARRLAIN